MSSSGTSTAAVARTEEILNEKMASVVDGHEEEAPQAQQAGSREEQDAPGVGRKGKKRTRREMNQGLEDAGSGSGEVSSHSRLFSQPTLLHQPQSVESSSEQIQLSSSTQLVGESKNDTAKTHRKVEKLESKLKRLKTTLKEVLLDNRELKLEIQQLKNCLLPSPTSSNSAPMLLPSSSSSSQLGSWSLQPSTPTRGGGLLRSTGSMTDLSIPSPIRSPPSHSVLILDVGGTKFKTSRDTLCKYSNSMLAAMFARSQPSEEGSYFIDRSPTHFATILEFLRTGKVTMPKDLEKTIELEAEFEYFGLPFPDDAYLHFPKCYAVERTIQTPFGNAGTRISRVCGRYIFFASSEKAAVFDTNTGEQLSEIDMTPYLQYVLCGVYPYSNTAEIFIILPGMLVLVDLKGQERKKVPLDPSISTWSEVVLCDTDGSAQSFMEGNNSIFHIKTQKLIKLEPTSDPRTFRVNGNHLVGVNKTTWTVWDLNTGEMIHKTQRPIPNWNWRVAVDGGFLLIHKDIKEKVCTATVVHVDGSVQGNFNVAMDMGINALGVIGKFIVGVKEKDVHVMEMHKHHDVRLERLLPRKANKAQWVYTLGYRIVVEQDLDAVVVLSPCHKLAV